MGGNETSQERIGEFLVRIGVITQEQLRKVLKKQEQNPDKLFGEIAIEMGFIDDDAITKYLASKKSD
jgi:hypothetical protein